jgi:ABC-type polysaccharide/polyol phosphate export permease
MAIFTLTIGRLAGVSAGGVDFAAFTLSALVHWPFLSTGVSFEANALITDGALIRKVTSRGRYPFSARSLRRSSTSSLLSSCSSSLDRSSGRR